MVTTLADLLDQIQGLRLEGDSATEISAVTVDSREAAPGVLFVAVLGTTVDGHGFLESAAQGGCAAVLVQVGSRSLAEFKRQFPYLPLLQAPSTTALPALIARILNHKPDTKLMTAGVTGTNGKTTVSFLLQKMLEQLQGPCGLLGTIRYDDGVASMAAPLTTPGGPMLYHWLGRMVTAGCQSVALEISSHALAQERTAGLHLDVAIMTNLGRDHLDYHLDRASYLQAKARIMDLLGGPETGRPGVLVLNAGDAALAALPTGSHQVLRFACQGNLSAENGVDLQVVAVDLKLNGTEVDLDFRGRKIQLISPLVGRFNVENLAAALLAGIALGFDADQVAQALALVPQVPGRLERILLPTGALAVVDYAHTHDALEAVLDACRELTPGKLTVVFGCGGDRDQGKRALMGAVAARKSDGVWITSDNPRSEDPAQICQEIFEGFRSWQGSGTNACCTVIDRREAIGRALSEARSGDVVVVAGKGHEDYQLVKDQVLALDDRAIIHDWIAEDANRD